MTAAERRRREGRADAVVMLVLKRVNAVSMTAEDWGALLEVSQAEVRAAVERLRDTPEARARARERARAAARAERERLRAEAKAVRDRQRAERQAARQGTRDGSARVGVPLNMPIVSCTIPGCGWTGKRLDRHMTSHEQPVACPKGCGRSMPPVGLPRHLTVCEGGHGG